MDGDAEFADRVGVVLGFIRSANRSETYNIKLITRR
jgi:hypothetical protein